MNANRLVRWLMGLFVTITVVTIGLIAKGTFDPKPVGDLRQVIRTPSLELDANGVYWLAALPQDFSVRAVLDSAENPYALLLGNPDNHLAIAIDPTSGFMSISQDKLGERDVLIPWQTWVHINRSARNEIWVDVQDQTMHLRFNRELFKQSPDWYCEDCQVGIWAGAEMVLETGLVETLEIYYP